jgi:hypothetical protein
MVPGIPALRRLRQQNCLFEVSLSYIVSLVSKKNNKQTNKKIESKYKVCASVFQHLSENAFQKSSGRGLFSMHKALSSFPSTGKMKETGREKERRKMYTVIII